MFKPKLLKKTARLVVLKTSSDIVDYPYDYADDYYDYSYYYYYNGLYDLYKMDLSNVLEYAY